MIDRRVMSKYSGAAGSFGQPRPPARAGSTAPSLRAPGNPTTPQAGRSANQLTDGLRIPRAGWCGKCMKLPMGIQIGSTNFAKAASAIAVCSLGGAPSCSRRPISIELSTTSLQRSSRREENAASALATVW
jgi:hypothetical protein